MKRTTFAAGSLLAALVVSLAIGPQASVAEVQLDVPPSADEIEASIARGLAWLVGQQNENGSWDEWGEPVATTSFALVKLEDLAFELGHNPFDPAYEYSQNVIAGLDYIFSQAAHPTLCCQEAVVFAAGHHEVYNTGVAMMAIAASKAPDRLVTVPGSVVNGWTYRQVLQANVDYFACSQIADGGWRYQCGDDWSDNSATGYVTLGLAYAESPVYAFESTVPQSVKAGLNSYVDHVQIDGETPHNGGSGYSQWDDTSNLLRAGNLVFEMAFLGDTPADPRMQRALDYIGRAWNDPDWSWWDMHSYPGWYGNPDWHGEPVHQDDPPDWWQGLEERWWGWQGPHYQAMYCLMKGLSFAGLDTVNVDGGEVDWYDAFAARILETQADEGFWHRDYWGGRLLATEWALLTLERLAPPRMVPVDVKPTSCPNPLNVGSTGSLPVAILGTAEFDVSQVDPASVKLEGVSPLRWSLEDVAAPYEPYTGKDDALDCTQAGSDGYLDLTLKFDIRAVVAALGEISDRDVRVLHLTGNLAEDGAPFGGEDVVVILKK
jgi:hypothetical protein